MFSFLSFSLQQILHIIFNHIVPSLRLNNEMMTWSSEGDRRIRLIFCSTILRKVFLMDTLLHPDKIGVCKLFTVLCP